MLRLTAVAAAGLWLALGPLPASASDQRPLPAGRAEAPDFAGKLPARVGDWKKPAQAQRWDQKTLYDYIDGGAELYLAYDFVGATSLEYSAGKDDLVKVDIFDMGGARGAFGAFAHGREAVASEVGQGSEYAGGLLTFWKDRYFVSVLGYPETAAKRKAVYELGKAIAALIPETGPLPEILKALPKDGLVEASARTFHHHLLQNDYVTVSHENVLGIDARTEAVQARYERKAGKHVLMVVDYPAEEHATAAHKALVEKVLGGATTAMKAEKWAGARRSGKRLVLVLDAPSKMIVEQVLSEVP